MGCKCEERLAKLEGQIYGYGSDFDLRTWLKHLVSEVESLRLKIDRPPKLEQPEKKEWQGGTFRTKIVFAIARGYKSHSNPPCDCDTCKENKAGDNVLSLFIDWLEEENCQPPTGHCCKPDVNTCETCWKDKIIRHLIEQARQ